MADDVVLNPGAGGDTIAADDVAGVKYQVVKLAVGADGAASLVANANPIPVSDASGSLTVDNGGTFAVQATLAAETTKVIGTINIAAAQTLATVTTVAAVTAISNALPAGNNNIGDVDIASIAAGNNNIGDVDIASIAAGTNNIGDVDVLTVPADPFGANADAASATGSISAKLRFIAATGIPVTSIAAGNNNIGDVDVASLPASTNTLEVVGDVAQDAAVGGNPVLVGLRASTATPTAMSADGDSVYAWADRSGAQVVVGNVLDDAAFTPGTNRVTPVGYLADESSTDSVDEGDIGAGRITLDRKQIITPYVHAAAGGWTPYKNLDCDETEDDIKTSAGKLGWIHVINRSTGVRYIKFFNATAANVAVGTTVPVLSFPVPTMADTNGAGFAISFGDAGVFFDTAISVAATTGVADADTGAPGTNDIVLNAGFI